MFVPFEFFEVIPHASTTSGPLNELCTTSPRVRNFVFKLLVLNKKTLHAQLFSFSKVVHQRTTLGVTLFLISKFYTTTPHVHMFVLSVSGCAPYAPRAQLRTIFRSCTCRTTNVKLLNLFTSCVPQMYTRLSFEPYLRVMTGNSWFNVRTVLNFSK